MNGNQTDHFCISRKFRRSLLDLQMRREADVGSDNHLLVATLKLKLKLKKHWMKEAMRFNTCLLKDPHKREKYTLNLKNRFQVLKEQSSKEEGHARQMGKRNRGHHNNMPGSDWNEKAPAEKMDISRNTSQDRVKATNEGRN